MSGERMRRYAFVILLAALVFQLIFSDGGVLGYLRLRREIRSLDASTKRLEAENVALRQQLDRLHKDDRYLEELARRQGFVRDGEKLYRSE